MTEDQQNPDSETLSDGDLDAVVGGLGGAGEESLGEAGSAPGEAISPPGMGHHHK
ncbi:MAG: hypothetical protein WCI74_09900 [Actinomycetes bacterium]